MPQLLSWKVGLPYHFSVGAVVTNNMGEILVHRWMNNPHFQNKEIFILMRETPEENEGLEEAVRRGLAEEFGISATIVDYIGSITAEFKHGQTGEKVEKTTTYFLCKNPVELPKGRSGEGLEVTSTLEWHEPKDLAGLSERQGLDLNSSDLDESKILLRVASILEKKN